MLNGSRPTSRLAFWGLEDYITRASPAPYQSDGAKWAVLTPRDRRRILIDALDADERVRRETGDQYAAWTARCSRVRELVSAA